MDKLEEYIMKNREGLDRYKPASVNRRKIRKGLNAGNLSRYRWISVAAMVAVILGTAVVILKPGNRLSRQERGEENFRMMMKNNSQLRETEIYYNTLANSLYREATPLLAKNPEMEKELFSDISQIDSICSEIKKDLKDNVSNQDVIEALIQNYRIKISLLEDMLEVLKENDDNRIKRNNHEL
ncbi:MAG: hypothetical protein IPJ37_00100 [Bacteroidales bacterium]|nr:hypothetical protein [Bacteroidales bacterium]